VVKDNGTAQRRAGDGGASMSIDWIQRLTERGWRTEYRLIVYRQFGQAETSTNITIKSHVL